MQVLICDVGGTNVRLGVFSPQNEEQIAFDKKYKCADFSSFEEVVATYLNETKKEPTSCVIGAAGNIDEKGLNVITTNTPWSVSVPNLKKSFPQIKNVRLVNDFALQGWALSEMTPQQYEPLYGAKEVDLSSGNILMIGPGTGLGTCFILQDPQTGKQSVYTAESGHTNVPHITWNMPQDNKDNYRILTCLEEFNHLQRKEMIVEHLVSGTGICNIYHALRDGHIPAQKEDRVSCQQIEEFAKQGDKIALRAFDFFFAYLGAQTGSLASAVKAKKVFFNGGVMMSPWILERMQTTSYFQDQAVKRAGMTEFMKRAQFVVSKERDMAVWGCKVCAKQLIEEAQSNFYIRQQKLSRGI